MVLENRRGAIRIRHGAPRTPRPRRARCRSRTFTKPTSCAPALAVTQARLCRSTCVGQSRPRRPRRDDRRTRLGARSPGVAEVAAPRVRDRHGHDARPSDRRVGVAWVGIGLRSTGHDPEASSPDLDRAPPAAGRMDGHVAIAESDLRRSGLGRGQHLGARPPEPLRVRPLPRGGDLRRRGRCRPGRDPPARGRHLRRCRLDRTQPPRGRPVGRRLLRRQGAGPGGR